MLRILLAALLLVTACRPRRDLSQYTVEDPKSALSTRIEIGNPRHAAQLKSGFHQIEEGGWRWAESRFTVELRAPFASQKTGARLVLKGNRPEVLTSRTGPVRLSAKLNETELASQSFAQDGEFTYTVEVPRAALSADSILVHFTTDKSLPPGTFPNDGRELALIVTSICLESIQ